MPILLHRLLLHFLQTSLKQRHRGVLHLQGLGMVGISISRDRQGLAVPSLGQGWALWLQAVSISNHWAPGLASGWEGARAQTSSLSPHAPLLSVQVPREPDPSAKSSPATVPALCVHLLEIVLQELQLLLEALDGGFQGADGGEHLLKHVHDWRNTGFVHDAGSPWAPGDTERREAKVCAAGTGAWGCLWDPTGLPQHQPHLAMPMGLP